jgi:hypothetical protein
MATTTTRNGETEVTILARVFDNDRGQLSRVLARAILHVDFSDRDKARMHELAVRNQDDALSQEQKKSCSRLPRLGRSCQSFNPKSAARSRSNPRNAPRPDRAEAPHLQN